jgi:hypothetical protein
MSKAQVLSAFFDQFQTFIDQLIIVFPTDDDFKIYLKNLKIARIANPKMVVMELERHCLPFEKLIRARDAKFFLEYPFAEYEQDETIIPVIRKIKGMWFQLSTTNQERILDYVVSLLNLVTRYIALSGSLLKK